MIPRTLEPEVMDSAEEAADYDAMDHAAVNEAFAADFLAAHGRDAGGDGLDAGPPVAVLDCGTGTALIPIAIVRRAPVLKITAVDLAEEMLKVARRNVAGAGLEASIEVRRADCKALPFADGCFDAVVSNTILHHIPDPGPALSEMARVLRPGGLMFVRDLLRPESAARVEELVGLHAGNANERQRALLRDSLHAALTVDEVREMLRDFGLPPDAARQTSDRHWTVACRR